MYSGHQAFVLKANSNRRTVSWFSRKVTCTDRRCKLSDEFMPGAGCICRVNPAETLHAHSQCQLHHRGPSRQRQQAMSRVFVILFRTAWEGHQPMTPGGFPSESFSLPRSPRCTTGQSRTEAIARQVLNQLHSKTMTFQRNIASSRCAAWVPQQWWQCVRPTGG